MLAFAAVAGAQFQGAGFGYGRPVYNNGGLYNNGGFMNGGAFGYAPRAMNGGAFGYAPRAMTGVRGVAAAPVVRAQAPVMMAASPRATSNAPYYETFREKKMRQTGGTGIDMMQFLMLGSNGDEPWNSRESVKQYAMMNMMGGMGTDANSYLMYNLMSGKELDLKRLMLYSATGNQGFNSGSASNSAFMQYYMLANDQDITTSDMMLYSAMGNPNGLGANDNLLMYNLLVDPARETGNSNLLLLTLAQAGILA